MREREKTKGKKSGDAGPVVVSCWPLYELMDFLSETIRHKRLLLISASMCTDIYQYFYSTATNFAQTQVPITP